MKRFAYVCADPGIPLPGTKGSSIHVMSVFAALRRAGLEGELYTVRPESDSLDGAAIRPIQLPERRKRKSQEERESRLFLASLNSVIAPESPPDFIYERYSLWHAGGLAKARELNIPFILEVNSPLPEEASKFRSLANEPLAKGIAQILMRESDGVVCVSDEIARWVVELRGHTGGVWVIPNGVDEKLFAPHPQSRPTPLPPPDVPLVAFCGSFRPWHGLEDLVNAFEVLASEESRKDLHLLCVGDGPMRDDFEAQVQRLSLKDRVHCTGRLPHSEVPRWLAGADIAVAPYPDLPDFYFSPLKIFEFLALGLPVVSTNIGQIRDLVPHQKRGFLYAPGDAQGLARTISHILHHPDEAQRIGEAGREWVVEHATWDKRVGEILGHVEDLP